VWVGKIWSKILLPKKSPFTHAKKNATKSCYKKKTLIKIKKTSIFDKNENKSLDAFPTKNYAAEKNNTDFFTQRTLTRKLH